MLYLIYATAPRSTPLLYSEFQTLLAAHKVNDLTIGAEQITGTITSTDLQGELPADKITALKTLGKPPYAFSTERVADPQLLDALNKAQIRFTGAPASSWWSVALSWAMPLVLFLVLWNMMQGSAGRSRSMFGIGKNTAKLYHQRTTQVTFDDIAGIDEAKGELMQIVDFLKRPERYRRLGGKIPKGVLITGAPGTGKTLLAKAVAGEAGVPFFSISGSAFVEMFVGVGAARVRDLFEEAKQQAPCIVFIDELDALGKRRSGTYLGGNEEREQTLNQLLVELDGFDTNSGVILVAATNRPEMLDAALLRPGRFDRHITIDRPDVNGREQILRVHARHVQLAPDVDLATIAARTPGFAGADLANIVNEAALHAALQDKPQIDMRDFDEAIDRAIGGIQRKSRVMTLEERSIIAFHEAGHALVAAGRPHADPVTKISIIPRGVMALGYTQQMPTADRYLLRASEVADRLDVLLGGRAAEEIVFGDISSGAESDLRQATELARQMVARCGMSTALGLAWFGGDGEQPGGDAAAMLGRSAISERTAARIEEEIERMLAEAHERAIKTLTSRRTQLERLAQALLQREMLDQEALKPFLQDTALPAAAPSGPLIEPPAAGLPRTQTGA
nr:ATP-dependent zinc metalloprotease FtsH [Pandoraea thiooxydans]